MLKIAYTTVFSAICLCTVSGGFAQSGKKPKKGQTPPPAATPAKPKDEKPSIASKIKTCIAFPGMFNVYQDTTTGKVYMLIKQSQLGKEFIHFTYTENGVLDAGFHRGQFRGSRVFTINKYYDNLEFVQMNTGFYFDPKNNISKSAEANISPAILAYEKIIAQDAANGEYLIDADELLLSEKLHQLKGPSMPGAMRFSLGMLSKGKTRFESLKSYPQNTDFVVRYVYDNPAPMVGGSEAVTDARAVTILLQHSFIQVPENNFQPRRDDARVGYFSEEVNDMTSLDAVNYKDMIHRWDLQKKDPSLPLSEPVKPIVWWIEKTTPKEFRETIKAAALSWNLAFEPIGFKNAVQVYEQPDTATWDAGDIRYNVLRWTSSPQPPFGGYGPSFVNPKTGEILGADIMLEYIFVTNRLIAEKLNKVPQGLENHESCAAGLHLHMETLLGKEMLMAAKEEVQVTELIKQSLYYLVLHEMGHTMGLMHNMKASQLHTPAELKDKSLTSNQDLIGSVMDYPAINLNFKDGEKVQYCQTRPGPYDMWAIQYGYSIAASNPEAEEIRLQDILSKSNNPELQFGNDADDMRSPGKAMDPRVMINDLSSDAIAYSQERMDKIMELMQGIKSRYSEKGHSYQELKNAFNNLSSGYAGCLGIVSRYVGGVYVERSAAGQSGATQPYTPVKRDDQKRAMQVLTKYAFAPDAFSIPADLIPFLQSQRRGFNFFASAEDPKLHARQLMIQAQALDHLLDNSVMQRLTDSKLYGNTYSLSDMLSDLTAGIFDADINSNVNSFRQQLQIDYVQRLLEIVAENSKTGHDALSIAKVTIQLKEISKKLKLSTGGDKESKDHRAYLVELINKALEGK